MFWVGSVGGASLDHLSSQDHQMVSTDAPF